MSLAAMQRRDDLTQNMNIARNKNELKRIIDGWKAAGLKIGFVPTMGALHEGHLSLVKIALEKADRVVVSIFVNPTQFAPHEDFSAYPRNEKTDLEKLERAGAHLVYIPSENDIYPVVPVSDLQAGSAAQELESDIRPGHFDGVATVVARLFRHVQPDIAVFGEKDYQQLCVLRQMVKQLDLPIEIIAAPIVRDEHGLALSSRNAYLSAEELVIARRLNKILFETAAALHPPPNGGRVGVGGNEEIEQAKKKLLAAGFDEVQYLELRDAETLGPPTLTLPPMGGGNRKSARLLAAVKIGKTRLIDNVAT